MNKTVSIQGQAGSYHDLVRLAIFGEESRFLARDTFKEVFADVMSGQAEYAIVAIENSLYGSINQVYDLLLRHKPWICDEYYLQIHHCLMGLPGTKLADITEVHSHPVALAQCEVFLDEQLPHAERFETHDTAGSAAEIAKGKTRHIATIASEQAARLYGLEIIERNVETNHENYTRFIVLQKDRQSNGEAKKTSVVLELPERPGILHEALGAFAQRDINLSKLESRPIIGKAWHYMFYLDFDLGLSDPKAKEALAELEAGGSTITVLGSYPQARKKL